MRRLLNLLVGLVLSSIVAAIFLAAPAELAWETVELLRMDASTEGVVEGLENKQLTGEPRFSRTDVRYAFLADGRRFQSDRIVPGFVGDAAYSEGGGWVASRYRKGRRVTVHYQRSDPNLCALEYGWYVGCVAVAAILGGIVVRGLALSGKPVSPMRKAAGSAGSATSLYGLGLPVVVDPAVRVAELPAHAASWLALFAVCLVFSALWPEAAENEPRRRSAWTLVFGGGDDDLD